VPIKGGVPIIGAFPLPLAGVKAGRVHLCRLTGKTV